MTLWARLREQPLLALAGVMLLALLVRLAALGGESFPANDGGLFAAMIEDLRANAYRIPLETSYNDLGLPFAYPPLALYLGALLSELPGIDTLEALRMIPLVSSTLTVPAVYPFARRVLRERWSAVLAMAIFALLPRAFIWGIMGGGLTRSVGMLLAVLALSPLYDVYVRNERRAVVPATVLVALAWLAHLEMGLFATYSAVLMFALHREDAAAKLRRSVAMGTGVALLTAPWWGTVLAYHGLEPFLDARAASHWTAGELVKLVFLRSTETPVGEVWSVLALVGVFWCLRERRWLLPVWLLAIFVLDPRKAATLGTVPLALLAAEGIAQVVLPALRSTGGAGPRWSPAGTFVGVAIALGAVGALLASAVTPAYTWSVAAVLPPEDRAAMEWVAASTPPDSAFVVLDDAIAWREDKVGEWFPFLAQRPSVATPQGWEWVPDGGYYEQIERYEQLQECRTQEAACVVEWSREHGLPFTHVYLSSRPVDEDGDPVLERLAQCCEALRASLLASPDFRLVHSGERVFVFEYLGAEALQRAAGPSMIARGDGAP